MTDCCIACESWREFKNAIEDRFLNPSDGTAWIFRGQASSEWRLVSSFDRMHAETTTRIEQYKKLLSEFRSRVHDDGIESIDQLHSDIQNPSRPKTTHEEHQWLVSFAQHHGLPTRLLDWSESPYVAAFFALEGGVFAEAPAGELQGDVAIWALNISAKAYWEEDTGATVWKAPRAGNKRALRQKGWFSELRSAHTSLEEHLATFGIPGIGTTPPLLKITVPSSQSKLALRDLALMGISPQTLFPGAEGMAKGALTRWKLEQS